jgi:DNA-binding FadR family transcriptional regulator
LSVPSRQMEAGRLIGLILVQNELLMPRQVSRSIELSLRRRIDSGEWRHSLRLPNERDLAVEYGVARNTIRSAIEELVAEGALSRQVGRGTFLIEKSEIDPTEWISKLAGVSPIDMMAVRMIFEPRAAELAAARASAGELDAIAAAHSAAVNATEMESFESWDAELHQRIFIATRNDLLNMLHELLRLIRNQELWLDIKRRSFSLERRAHYCAEHAAIVSALLRRDASQAGHAMLSHLRTVEANLTSPTPPAVSMEGLVTAPGA